MVINTFVLILVKPPLFEVDTVPTKPMHRSALRLETIQRKYNLSYTSNNKFAKKIYK